MVDDSLQLVRIGSEQFVGGGPAGMLGAVCPSSSCGMITRCPQPWIGQPHFSHGSPGSWWARSSGRLAWRMVRQRVHISTVNRPSTSLNGPVEVPQNEQCGPTPHLTRLELTFDKDSSRLKNLRSLRDGDRGAAADQVSRVVRISGKEKPPAGLPIAVETPASG
jgi:hypothetical protein